MSISALSSSAPLAKPNNFKYNGKEEQTEFDLNWYNYGARNYDAQLGRWNHLDPLAHQYFDHSPYHYSYNNPLLFVDPDGREIWLYWDTGKKDDEGKVIEMKVQYRADGKLYNEDGKEYTGDNKFFKQTAETLSYLREEGTGTIEGTDTNIFDDLLKPSDGDKDKTTHIRSTDDLRGNRALGNFIRWNPVSGLEVQNNFMKDTGGRQSPALGLLHELGHSWTYLFDKKNRENRQEEEVEHQWDSGEEKFIIEKIENPAADILEESKRFNHRGKGYETENPKTTKAAKTGN